MPRVYLLLAILGAAVPYLAFVPWLAEHGLNFARLWQEIAKSRLSTFAWLDVVLSVVTILVWSGAESRRLRMPPPWLPVLACGLVGASCDLPLFLYQREQWLARQG